MPSYETQLKQRARDAGVFPTQEQHILKGSLAYLIGSIDFAPDLGRGWREEIIEQTAAKKIKTVFLDPTNKITGLQEEVGAERERMLSLAANRNWDQLSAMMKKVVREDHRCVDICDFVIAYIDVDIHACGSYFELHSALNEKKPYFIIVKGGKERTPGWLFGIVDHNYIFNSIEEVVEELDKLNRGLKPLSDRWVLIRKQLDRLTKE